MITIKIKALTVNAYTGLERHYKDCLKLGNKIKLRANKITQELKPLDQSLEISYSSLLNRVQEKLTQINSKLSNFKAELKEEQKEEFLKQVNSFMIKQKVKKYEYEVIFKDDTK